MNRLIVTSPEGRTVGWIELRGDQLLASTDALSSLVTGLEQRLGSAEDAWDTLLNSTDSRGFSYMQAPPDVCVAFMGEDGRPGYDHLDADQVRGPRNVAGGATVS